jgi:hypothetical protein
LPDPTNLAPTGADAYLERMRDGVLVTLPSGDVVRIGPISAVDLAAAGGIPDRLTAHVFADMPSMLREARGDEEATARLYRERVEVIDTVCCAILREPRMVPEPAEGGEPPAGAIFPAHMPWGDRMHLYRLATGEASLDLARFRRRPTAGVHAAPNGDGLLDAAERDPRPPAG